MMDPGQGGELARAQLSSANFRVRGCFHNTPEFQLLSGKFLNLPNPRSCISNRRGDPRVRGEIWTKDVASLGTVSGTVCAQVSVRPLDPFTGKHFLAVWLAGAFGHEFWRLLPWERQEEENRGEMETPRENRDNCTLRRIP